jgi:hypothetical protein
MASIKLLSLGKINFFKLIDYRPMHSEFYAIT